MRKFQFLLIAFGFLSSISVAQQKKTKPKLISTYPAEVNRPKLVVGLVVDQMRWDYLYRYYNRYTNGGFKRLINEGFSAENTYI
ncbi:MAG: alkaline phosphatase family protein, partial [Pedobacter sp.]